MVSEAVAPLGGLQVTDARPPKVLLARKWVTVAELSITLFGSPCDPVFI